MKPILFNTEMARAILDGRKAVTRRLVKPQPEGRPIHMPPGSAWPGYFAISGTNKIIKPPCQPGDILYVREAWAKAFGVYWHKAGLVSNEPGQIPGMIERTKWRPSIHMPKEAARLFLRVEDVRVERLQEITHDGIRKEGIVTIGSPGSPERINPLSQFKNLWDSTIKKADLPCYGWAANPWVWVIEFERIRKEEAQKGGEG